MNVVDNKAYRGSAKAINVAILMLIILNSGGIKILEHYQAVYITIVTLSLLALKVGVEKRFSVVLFFKIMAFSSTLLLFNVIVTNSWSGVKEYSVILSYLLTAALLLSTYHSSNDCFISDLYLALKIVLFHSMISFLFQFVATSFLFPISDRIQTFYYLFYYMFDGHFFVARNQGFFWEPGVLQIFLNILLYIALFVRKNLWVAFFTTLAILTTFSTTGYITLFIIVSVASLKNIRKSYLVIVGVMILLPIVSMVVYTNVYEKFTGTHAKSASVRMFDINIGTSMLADYPLVGIGLDKTKYREFFFLYGIDKIKKYGIAKHELEAKGITNSVLFLATVFGLPIAIMLMILLYKQSLLPGSPGLLFTVFFISGLSEPIFNTVFFILFFTSSHLNKGKFRVGKSRCHSER